VSGIHSQLRAILTVLYQGLTAIVFLTICAANIVYPSPEIYSEMFVVPIGALFAFSSVRANFPGAPAGFGEFCTDLLKSVLEPIAIIGATIGNSSAIDDIHSLTLKKSSDMFTIVPVLIIMSSCVSLVSQCVIGFGTDHASSVVLRIASYGFVSKVTGLW